MPETLSTEDAAKLLGCSAKWLSEQCARRRVPHSIIARRIRFTPEHIAAIIRMNEVPMSNDLDEADQPVPVPEARGPRRSPARAYPDPDVRPPT